MGDYSPGRTAGCLAFIGSINLFNLNLYLISVQINPYCLLHWSHMEQSLPCYMGKPLNASHSVVMN